jgi:DNA-binding MarR family transcriptional regulator
MDEQLKRDLMDTFFRFKRIKPAVFLGEVSKQDLNILETVMLKKISDGHIDSFSDLEDEFHVSKPAISQILSALERKGYITRELDKTNRRKRSLGLTRQGSDAVETTGRQIDAYFAGVIERFGENDTRRLVRLFKRFAELVERKDM